jgi:hypothetical protein
MVKRLNENRSIMKKKTQTVGCKQRRFTNQGDTSIYDAACAYHKIKIAY